MKNVVSLLFLSFAFSLGAAEPVSEAIEVLKTRIVKSSPATSTEGAADQRTEKNIARITAKLLEQIHYSQRPFDDELSSKLLDRYMDTLDGMHLHLLQSDVAEFEIYRLKLDDLTLKAGDVQPAHQIFARMLQRAQERVAYVNQLLKTEKFEFKGNERYVLDRRHAPRPLDIEDAHKLWRHHLRSEFLQEKLALTNKTNLAAANKTSSPKSSPKIIGDEKTNLASISIKTNSLTPNEEIIKKITKRYANLQRTLKELSDDEVFELYLNSLARVYDPHSDYMGRSHFENFNISMKLALVGIGALLESEDGYCKIKELMPGPAMLSKKIKPGDRIVAVAQGDKEPVDVVDMKLNKVVELIRGTKGTEVRLNIWPADAADSSIRKVVTLVRDIIKLEDQEAKAKVIEHAKVVEVSGGKEPVRLGVIDLPSFYADMDGGEKGGPRKSTTADIARLLKKLNKEKVSGVILDLRRNGGGLLEEAVNLTGLFITNGPVVQVKDPAGEIVTLSDPDSSIAYKGPLVILTSHFSASASEILAGALQDYGRALIVGDSSTYGKGTVQKLLRLDPYLEQNKLAFSYDPGALKPTTAKFYRAGGSSTQLRGVIPDIKLPTVIDFAEVGEASLENPLPWDEVSTAKFEKWNLVKPFLPELQKRSDRRLQSDKEFTYIHEDIQQFKKNLADKSISLNEEFRRKENKEAEARADARKKERKNRKPLDQKVFEVTLKNADEPGLQPFVPKTNDVAAAASDPSDIEEGIEEKIPVVDATLEETERILLDYISLLPNRNPGLSKVE
ncbi:MAG: carboxy terminal-processing peptidase [Verrucomicrobiota bacterium]